MARPTLEGTAALETGSSSTTRATGMPELPSRLATDTAAPAPEGLLEAYEISTAVNRAANDSPALIEPLAASSLHPPPHAGEGKGGGAPAAATPAAKPKKGDGQMTLL